MAWGEVGVATLDALLGTNTGRLELRNRHVKAPRSGVARPSKKDRAAADHQREIDTARGAATCVTTGPPCLQHLRARDALRDCYSRHLIRPEMDAFEET